MARLNLTSPVPAPATFYIQFVKVPIQPWRTNILRYHQKAQNHLIGRTPPHPPQVLQSARHRRTKGLAFSVRVVKYWNKLQASVVTAPSAIFFQESLDRSFSLSHPLTEHSPPPPFPLPPAHHPLTVVISMCYPTPCFIYIYCLFRPVVAYFYHHKS